MPKYIDIKLRPCPDRPKKEVIFQEILGKVPGNRSLGFNFNEVQKVNTEWLLTVLSTLDPTNRLFAKNYIPSEDERRNRDHLEEKLVDNSDGFYTGLPENNLKRMKAKKITNIAKVIPSENKKYSFTETQYK